MDVSVEFGLWSFKLNLCLGLDNFVLVLFAFVLGLRSSVPSQEIGWKEKNISKMIYPVSSGM